jgi:hypothetical protein
MMDPELFRLLMKLVVDSSPLIIIISFAGYFMFLAFRNSQVWNKIQEKQAAEVQRQTILLEQILMLLEKLQPPKSN